MTENEIQQLKNKLEDAKINKSRAEGVIKQITSTLKSDFDISNPDKIPGTIKTLKNQLTDLDAEITEIESDLQKELEG